MRILTFIELMKKFPTEEAVIEYYIKIRYPDGVYCRHCGSVSVYHRTSRPKVFNCRDCNNTFSPFTGTIFEKSSTDLRKWMYAIHLFLNGKKGISGLQLQREIGVTYKTAWRMLQEIRIAIDWIPSMHVYLRNTTLNTAKGYMKVPMTGGATFILIRMATYVA